MSDRDENFRTRNFATLIYLDSAPANWLNLLSDLHIPAFISPLHDKDVYDDPTKDNFGKPKKPHFHVQLMFDSVKTIKQVENIISKFGGVGCEVLDSTRGYARYLCHLDNPDKPTYNIDDVIQLSGANYLDLINNSDADRLICIKEMQEYVDENDIISFYQLMMFAKDNNTQWYRSLCSNSAYCMKEFIKSRTWFIHKKVEQ